MGTDEAQPADDAATESEAAEHETGEQQDTRARFREALAKKQERSHLGASGGGKANQSPHVAPAKQGRTFRRKSG